MMHSLFEDTETLEKEHRITSALDAISNITHAQDPC